MNFTRLHHVSLNVNDIATAEPFYVDVLGFEKIDRPDLGIPGAWFAAGDQQLHLIEVAGATPAAGQHFAVLVDDIEAAIAELAAHDVRVSPIGTIDGVCRQAFFSDPSGNLIEVNEPAH
jgi:catechol 2,3-dioxygenase-like lactoylglutathione lyase family enzyme